MIHNRVVRNYQTTHAGMSCLHKILEEFKMKDVYYERFSKEALIQLAKLQEQELIKLEAIKNQYAKHLEQVIEYNSIEKYRETVKQNNK